MTAHDIGPAFVQIDYKSQHAKHKMQIPINAITLISGDPIEPDNWETVSKNGSTVWGIGIWVVGLIDLLKVFCPPTTNFTSFTLYQKAGAGSPAHPVATRNIGIAGTNGAGAPFNDLAWQNTWSFSTSLFNKYKLVLVDGINATAFKSSSLSGRAADVALASYILNDLSIVVGRDNAAVARFVSLSININKRLLRAYSR